MPIPGRRVVQKVLNRSLGQGRVSLSRRGRDVPQAFGKALSMCRAVDTGYGRRSLVTIGSRSGRAQAHCAIVARIVRAFGVNGAGRRGEEILHGVWWLSHAVL